MAKTDFKSVDEYMASQPEAVRGILGRVRTAILKAVPGAEEVISYKIPTYKLHSGPVLYFAGWKHTTRSTPHRARRRGVQGRTCIVRGQQGHNPVPALSARPSEIDRTHREVSREGSRRAQESEGSHPKER